MFEQACQEHAALLGRRHVLPAEMVVGRWWRDETAEVDVLGLLGDRTGLRGECRWQTAAVTSRDLVELQRKLAYVPEPADQVLFRFWTRTGAASPGLGVTVHSADDVVGVG